MGIPQKPSPVPPLSYSYSEEINVVLLETKNQKAAGVDGIPPNFLKNLGRRGWEWLAVLFTAGKGTREVPTSWQLATVFALLKPRKLPEDADSYYPISLLSTTSKVVKQVLLC